MRGSLSQVDQGGDPKDGLAPWKHFHMKSPQNLFGIPRSLSQ